MSNFTFKNIYCEYNPQSDLIPLGLNYIIYTEDVLRFAFDQDEAKFIISEYLENKISDCEIYE